eukprot:m.327321 g.327321  ORF g.327321 m.327321 type:complete len:363 (-) comp19748_c3_seq5:360-1448(-)
MKYFNDALYGFVELPEYVRAVVDTPLFQRLRYVRQVGSVNMVWPCANHSRFEHSLGTMHLAREYLRHLKLDEDEEDCKAFVLAAALHDVGHGPFSHTFEHAIKGTKCAEIFKDHDEWRFRLLRENKRLRAAVGETLVEKIASVWTGGGDGQLKQFHTLIAGPAGVDRMDYILRDSYHTKPLRVLEMTCIQRIMFETRLKDGRVCYTRKGLASVQNLLENRMYLYTEVYGHKTAQAADVLLYKLFSQPLFTDEVYTLLDPNKFETLDDDFIRSQPFMRRYKERQLPKVVSSERGTTGKVGYEDSHDGGETIMAIRNFSWNEFEPSQIGLYLSDGRVADITAEHMPEIVTRTLTRKFELPATVE